MPEVEIVETPARRLLAVAHRGPYPEIGAAFGRLADLIAEHGLQAAAGELVGVYHDSPDATPAAALRAHAGVVVGEAVPCPPGLEELWLPAGRHATLRVIGPYDQLGPAHAWLHGDGLAAAGLAPGDGPVFEIYRNDPRNAAPAALVTDLYAPVA